MRAEVEVAPSGRVGIGLTTGPLRVAAWFGGALPAALPSFGAEHVSAIDGAVELRLRPAWRIAPTLGLGIGAFSRTYWSPEGQQVATTHPPYAAGALGVDLTVANRVGLGVVARGTHDLVPTALVRNTLSVEQGRGALEVAFELTVGFPKKP